MDVLVIGAGIVGVSAGRHLAGGGATVTVVDRGPVGGEASGLNAGIIGGGGWGHDPDLQVTLKMGSRELFVELSEVGGHDIGLDLTGTLSLIRSEAEWAWADASVAADRAAGRELELVSASDLVELEPAADPTLLGAILDPFGARAEPVAATRAFAAAAASAGATVETGVTVTGLRAIAGGGWEVTTASTAGGEAVARGFDAVVIAAGPWCAALGSLVGLDVPIVAVRGQMWACEPEGLRLRHAIAAIESPLAWSAGSGAESSPPELTHHGGERLTRHLYGRQRPNGEIVFGGDRVLTSDRTIDGDGISVNFEHVAELLPALAGRKITRTWAGLMPFSLDGAPSIGPVDDQPGLYLAGGLASSGFGRGPMAGRIIAEQVLGQREP